MKYILITLLSFYSYGSLNYSSLDLQSADSEWGEIDHLASLAEVLALGESGHGVSRFLKARSRVIKYLIEKHDYRLIILENEYIKTEQVNAYLDSCFSNASFKSGTDITSKFDLIYKNEETKELLEWACKFNSKKPAVSISFHGMDIWENPWEHRKVLFEEIEKRKLDKKYQTLKRWYDQAYSNCFGWDSNSWEEASKKPYYEYYYINRSFDPKHHALCRGALFNLKYLSQVNYPVDGKNNFWLNLAANLGDVYERVINFRDMDMPKALNIRDEAQAYLTVAWMKYYKNKKKSILLAHNLHISKKQSVIIPMDPGSLYPWKNTVSTGENLVGHFGRAYKSIAITGYDITSSRDGRYIRNSKEDALDYRLSLGDEVSYFHTDELWLEEFSHWWLHNEGQPMFLSPKEQYDAILFIRESTGAQTLKV